MNIVVNPGMHLSNLTSYFDFNQIAYELFEFYNSSKTENIGDFDFSNQFGQKNLIILNWDIMQGVMSDQPSFSDFVKVCQTNTVWIWSEIDGLAFTLLPNVVKKIHALDQLVPKQAIKIFFDGHLDSTAVLNLTNITYESFPYNFFLEMRRITQAQLHKKHCSKDYLMTTIKRPFRPHRDILFEELQKQDLLSKGHVKYTTKLLNNYIGSHPPGIRCREGHPSMDLYLDSWMEIVPETLHEQGWFITEKTVKPMATKTPFVAISTSGYLKYLKNYGFRTFDSLINEDYDQITDLVPRVQRAVDCVKDIIANGSEKFYTASLPILQHNLQRLFEITGRKQFEMDCFIQKQLEEVMAKK